MTGGAFAPYGTGHRVVTPHALPEVLVIVLHRPIRPLLALAVAAALTATGCGTIDPMPIPDTVAAGNNASAGDVDVRNVFVLGPAPGTTIPAGGAAPVFVSLVNDGVRPDRLVSVSAPGTAASATITGGGIDLPVHRLVPGGPHPWIMLEKLARPVSGNDTVRVVFELRDAGTVTVDAPVMADTGSYTTFSPTPAPPATPPRR